MTLTPLPASPPSPAGGPAPSPSGGSPDPEFEALVASHRERADAHSDRTPAGVTSGSPDHGGPAGPQATRHNGADAPNREKDDRDEPASAGSAAQQPPAGSQGATPGQGVPTAAAPTQPSGPGGSPAGASTGGPAVTAPAAGAAAVAGPARSSARSTASGKQPGTISAGPGQRSGATVGGAAQPAARGSGAPGHAAPAPGTGAGSTGTAAPVSRNPALSGAAGRVAGQAAGTSAGQAAGTSAGQARHAVTDSDGDLHAGTTTPASGAGASGVPVPTAPNAPVSAAAPSAGGPAGGTSTAVPVPAQLQPSLVRLVSRGDGTHRMSLRLHPAELGEVRLTVTVKDGAVDVAMAAGPEAQDTLREGSAQLRAMLSGSGHTLGQLVVQNLPGPATPPAAGSGTAAQGGTQPGAGQGSPQGSAQGAPQGSAQGSGHGFGQPGQHAGQHAGQHQPGREWAGGTPAATSPGGAPVVPPDRAPGPHAARGPRPGIDVRI